MLALTMLEAHDLRSARLVSLTSIMRSPTAVVVAIGVVVLLVALAARPTLMVLLRRRPVGRRQRLLWQVHQNAIWAREVHATPPLQESFDTDGSRLSRRRPAS